MTINIKDIDSSLLELNIAIRDHYNWANKCLRLSLLGGEPDKDVNDSDAHQHCRFSHWLNQRMQGANLDRELILLIDRQHAAMHVAARVLMLSIIAGKVSEELLNDYNEAQQKFISSIDKYKEYLFSYRNLYDALTGLPLRHLLYQEFPLIRSRSERVERSLYLLIMDIDRFKTINDTWGHNAGDDVLRSVASILKEATRNEERIYRFGGEEFIMLLEASSREQAERAGKRICQHLASHPVSVDDQNIKVTVTGGLTLVSADDSLHSAIGRADKAMYYGKNTGRNRCILALSDQEMVTLE
ncbi:Diguanylate cyclase YdeH [Cedecea lapagei]|uniref:diguanylate cyclase n=1 Tax=Cedecea lapagei TaxID=158823 RepID=A0A3S4MGU9_9ENTR|nr:diguanylate cyclase [Cedecea lapagei]VEC01085.1 Diguanylate cyclase YdeH [Cedecea lapagei]